MSFMSHRGSCRMSLNLTIDLFYVYHQVNLIWVIFHATQSPLQLIIHIPHFTHFIMSFLAELLF